eukprot:2494504-Rhodomonas_salina.1
MAAISALEILSGRDTNVSRSTWHGRGDVRSARRIPRVQGGSAHLVGKVHPARARLEHEALLPAVGQREFHLAI